MILHLTGEVEKKMVDDLISIIDSYIDKERKEGIKIYFKSSGGDAESMEALIHMINENKEIITLISYGSIESAAFILFFKSNCKRVILPGTQGMAHQIRIKIEMRDHKTGYYASDRAGQDWVDAENKALVKFLKNLGLDNKEMVALKKGEEVHFDATRLNQFLDYQNNG